MVCTSHSCDGLEWYYFKCKHSICFWKTDIKIVQKYNENSLEQTVKPCTAIKIIEFSAGLCTSVVCSSNDCSVVNRFSSVHKNFMCMPKDNFFL